MNVCLALLLALSPTDVGVRVVDNDIEIRFGDELFTRVHTGAEPRPYLYPVLAEGGVPMTRGWPMEERPHEERDHPHHQSFWYAHGAVNGHDFWHDPEARVVLVEKPWIMVRDGTAVVICEYQWMAKEERVLTERRVFTFERDGSDRMVDVSIELRASEGDLLFGDTKEGTFAFRVHPNLRLRGEVAKGSVLNREKVSGKDAWGKRSAWVAYQGPVEGAEVGVAIFDHSDNPRHPTWWHARDYGLFAANPFGAHDFEGAPAGTGDLKIAKGEIVTFQYRVTIFKGTKAHADLEAAYTAFTK